MATMRLAVGTAIEVRAQRPTTLDAAYAAHPERFGHR
jgi:putative transposase